MTRMGSSGKRAHDRGGNEVRPLHNFLNLALTQKADLYPEVLIVPSNLIPAGDPCE